MESLGWMLSLSEGRNIDMMTPDGPTLQCLQSPLLLFLLIFLSPGTLVSASS